MSNENQETIADIVREMRDIGRLDEKSTDKIPRSLQALGLRTYADRIEAAHKRELEDAIAATVVDAAKTASEVYEPHIKSEPVGNVAKMRAALEQIRELLSIGGNPDTPMCIRYEAAYQIAKEALSAPLRNCDKQFTSERVSADDVEQAWLVFRRCDPNVYFDVPGLLMFIVWLFAEAKGE